MHRHDYGETPHRWRMAQEHYLGLNRSEQRYLVQKATAAIYLRVNHQGPEFHTRAQRYVAKQVVSALGQLPVCIGVIHWQEFGMLLEDHCVIPPIKAVCLTAFDTRTRALIRQCMVDYNPYRDYILVQLIDEVVSANNLLAQAVCDVRVYDAELFRTLAQEDMHPKRRSHVNLV